MQPEFGIRQEVCTSSIERLADMLFHLAGDQEVRIVEALAAVVARCWREGLAPPQAGLAEASVEYAATNASPNHITDAQREICRRVARRALRGSLVDPTRGATAVHRIGTSPAWSRDLLPIGMFGPFLFYRLSPAQLTATDWPGIHEREQQSLAGLDWLLCSDSCVRPEQAQFKI